MCNIRVGVVTVLLVALSVTLSVTAALQGQAQKPADPGKVATGQLTVITKQLLDMAEDFPAEKYDFKATPEVRSFREVIVHAMSGTVFAGKVTRDDTAKWTELDPKNYKDKPAVVEAFKKAVVDLDSLKGLPADRVSALFGPLVSVIEHTAEHYGQLVVYYRLNKLVPPASRPAKK